MRRQPDAPAKAFETSSPASAALRLAPTRFARQPVRRRCGAPAEPDAPASVTPPESPFVARVVPDVTGLDKQFDYLVPDQWRQDVGAGTIVRIGLAGRRVGG